MQSWFNVWKSDCARKDRRPGRKSTESSRSGGTDFRAFRVSNGTS